VLSSRRLGISATACLDWMVELHGPVGRVESLEPQFPYALTRERMVLVCSQMADLRLRLKLHVVPSTGAGAVLRRGFDAASSSRALCRECQCALEAVSQHIVGRVEALARTAVTLQDRAGSISRAAVGWS